MAAGGVSGDGSSSGGGGGLTIASPLVLYNHNNNIHSGTSSTPPPNPSQYLASIGTCDAVCATLRATPGHSGVVRQGLSAVYALITMWPPNKAVFGALDVGDAMVGHITSYHIISYHITSYHITSS